VYLEIFSELVSYLRPVTGQIFTGQIFTGQVFTGQIFTGQVFTGQVFTGQVFTGQVFTGQVFTYLTTGQISYKTRNLLLEKVKIFIESSFKSSFILGYRSLELKVIYI
jgi:hypothetical protein